MEINAENEDLLSDAFVWSEHSWSDLHPETTGLPAILYIDARTRDKSVIRNGPGIKDITGTPFSTFNLHLVMFYPYKDRNRTKGQNERYHCIPMEICDKPYIPKEYAHRKHELNEDELNQIKNWVAKYKDALLMTSDDDTSVEESLEKLGATKYNYINQEPLSEEFVWDERIWDYLEPEHSGLPVTLFIDEHIQDKTATPLIMFCPYKHPIQRMKTTDFLLC